MTNDVPRNAQEVYGTLQGDPEDAKRSFGTVTTQSRPGLSERAV